MRDLVIVGAGGHGRELLDVVEAINAVEPTWRFLGFLDDGTPPADPLERRGARVVGPVAALAELSTSYAIGIGVSETRRRIDELALAADREPAVLVHPLASMGSDVELGPGVVLAAGARVTTNVRLGRHTHINAGAVVSHDGRIADYGTISPGALVNGTVTLEECVLLGTASVITPGCTVGRGTWVGAGAVVLHDLPAGVIATGVPARVRRVR